MMYQRFSFSFLLLSFLPIASANAASDSAEYELGEEARVYLRNFRGDVKIVPGASDKVRVSYTTVDDRIAVNIQQRTNSLRIRTDYDSANRVENASVNYEIELPRGARAVVNNTAGSISLSGGLARIEFTTVSGDITLADVRGEISLETVSGDIVVRAVSEAELKASTISGRIDIASSTFSGEIYDLESISGDISVTHGGGASYFLRARTNTGSIENSLGHPERIVMLGENTEETVNQFQRYSDSLIAERTTVFGGYKGNASSATVELQTVSGNIVLRSD